MAVSAPDCGETPAVMLNAFALLRRRTRALPSSQPSASDTQLSSATGSVEFSGLRRRTWSLDAVRLRRIVRLARRLPACSAGTKDARSTHAPKEGHEAVLLACAESRWITVLVASAQHRSNDNAREGRHCSTT